MNLATASMWGSELLASCNLDEDGWRRNVLGRELHHARQHPLRREVREGASSAPMRRRCTSPSRLPSCSLMQDCLSAAAVGGGEGRVNCRPKRCLPIKLSARPAPSARAPLLLRRCRSVGLLRHFVPAARVSLSRMHFCVLLTTNRKRVLCWQGTLAVGEREG